MKVKLPALSYPQNSLEPYISENTIQFHYGKHHNAYVENTIKLISGTELEDKSLEDIIHISFGNEKKLTLFNNAAQVWNHSFYWNCMKPSGGGNPIGAIKDKIDSSFESYEKFMSQFKNIAMTQFGSGWAWLVLNNESSLEIVKTSNADSPITHNLKPLLTVDVWEHAYYLDYQNKRADYLNSFFENLINWEFVNTQI
jgi:Fe-Mn family superoxide dismutase